MLKTYGHLYVSCKSFGIFHDFSADKYPIIWYERLGSKIFYVLADCRDFPGILLGELTAVGEVLV